MNTIEAVVKNGMIVPTGEVHLKEGEKVFITLESYDEEFWLSANSESLNNIWNNEEDNVYAELLAE